MRYEHLLDIIKAYEAGGNVTEMSRMLSGEDINTPEIIEVAYDLQAGTYSDFALQNSEYIADVTCEMAEIIQKYCGSDSLDMLDAGTGEMTRLGGVLEHLSEDTTVAAFDISWSRIRKGKAFLAGHFSNSVCARIEPFVADMFHIPLADNSVDVVMTSHSLEPNGGREAGLVGELLRVARQKVIMIEPSYEHNSPEGRKRMDHHGYVKDLPTHIEQAGGQMDALFPLRNSYNKENPSYVHVVTPDGAEQKVKGRAWVCPVTKRPLLDKQGFYWCPESKLVYPVIDGIPLLRQELAILASALG